jgi:hypothetical protein
MTYQDEENNQFMDGILEVQREKKASLQFYT